MNTIIADYSRFAFLFLLLSTTSYAQQESIASIDKKLEENKLVNETLPQKAIEIYTDLYQKSEKIGYKRGMAYSHYKLSESYDYLTLTDKVFEHAEKAEEIARDIKDYSILVNAISLKAFAVGSVSSYDNSIKQLKDALVYAEKINDRDDYYLDKGMLYFSIANIFSWDTKIQTDSALFYNNKSLQSFKRIHDKPLRNRQVGSVYIAIGENYLIRDDLNSAAYFIQKGLKLPKKKGDEHYDMYGYQGLADIYNRQKNYALSIKNYKKAIALAKEYKCVLGLRELYFGLSDVYLTMHQNDSSKVALDLYRNLSDSIDVAERTRVDQTTKVILKKYKENNEEYKMRLYSVIAFTVFLVIALIYFSNRLYRRYLNEKKEKRVQEVRLLDKNTKLNVMSLRVSTSYEEIIFLAKSGDPKFATLFKELYPDFYNKLMRLQPNLTLIEQKFCFFIKLKFSTKEIAEYTFVTPKAIQNRKNRIRKRLGIPESEDIYIWIENL